MAGSQSSVDGECGRPTGHAHWRCGQNRKSNAPSLIRRPLTIACWWPALRFRGMIAEVSCNPRREPRAAKVVPQTDTSHQAQKMNIRPIAGFQLLVEPALLLSREGALYDLPLESRDLTLDFQGPFSDLGCGEHPIPHSGSASEQFVPRRISFRFLGEPQIRLITALLCSAGHGSRILVARSPCSTS